MTQRPLTAPPVALQECLPEIEWHDSSVSLAGTRFRGAGRGPLGEPWLAVEDNGSEERLLAEVLDGLSAGPALNQLLPELGLPGAEPRILVLAVEPSASLRRRLAVFGARILLFEVRACEARGARSFITEPVPLLSHCSSQNWENLPAFEHDLLERFEEGLAHISSAIVRSDTPAGARRWSLGGELLAELRLRAEGPHAIHPWAGPLRDEEALESLLEACVERALHAAAGS